MKLLISKFFPVQKTGRQRVYHGYESDNLERGRGGGREDDTFEKRERDRKKWK